MRQKKNTMAVYKNAVIARMHNKKTTLVLNEAGDKVQLKLESMNGHINPNAKIIETRGNYQKISFAISIDGLEALTQQFTEMLNLIKRNKNGK